jgi:hypothetical protein
VLAGFPDVLLEAMAINTPQDAPNSVQKLILTAPCRVCCVLMPRHALAASDLGCQHAGAGGAPAKA